jgi:hypothetical protein
MNLEQNKVTFPGYPEWLDAVGVAVDKGNADQFSEHLTVLLANHHQAEAGRYDSAEVVAEQYESGDVPCGANLRQAVLWHAYAAELGSIKSALRLAQLQLWMKSETDHVERAVEMAKKTMSNAMANRYPSEFVLNSAAAATLLILDNGADTDGIELIKELLAHKKFAGHPDHSVIYHRLQLLRSQSGEEKLSLKVASSKIAEDSDFKVGIYKALERPLPLVRLPDPEMIKNTLDREFPWFANVNDVVYRQLVVQQLNAVPAFKLRPLLLAGAPGVGKTSWVKRLAELCQVPFRSVMAGGASDSMYLRGTPRGWSSARPGAILQTIVSEGIANPLFLVDELEKASPDARNGRIWDVLLQLLEEATSKVYLDECLGVPCDLSQVNWIASVNKIGEIPAPLLERFTIVVVKAPGPEHFMTLVNNVVHRYAKEFGIDVRMLPSLDNNDLDVLRKTNGPREISRTARLLIEKRVVDERRNAMRN